MDILQYGYKIKQINKKIGEIKRSGKALTDKIVLVELAAMIHCREHNDSGALSRLVHAMPKSGRREALLVHIVDHSPLSWDKEKEVFKASKKGVWNIEGAISVPFYEYTKETVTKIDLKKQLTHEAYARFVKSVEKRVEKSIEDGAEYNSDELEAFSQRLSVAISLNGHFPVAA